MTRIDEIRERLDKARPGLGEIDGGEELLKRRGNPKGLYTWTLYGTYADAILLVNARNDLAWLLDVLARRDQRCEDLAVSLDETRASLDAAIAAHDRELREQIEQEVRADMFHGVRAWVERFSPGDRWDPQDDLAASLDEMRAAHSPTTTTTRRTP